MDKLRQKYPEYNDLSDQELADGFYKKHYSDMDRSVYDKKMGLAPKIEEPKIKPGLQPQTEGTTPTQALNFAIQKQTEAGGAFVGGLKNFAQKTGTAVNQLASELGTDVFANMAKVVAKLQRPDLKDELDKYSTEDITNLITKTTEEEVAQREQEAKQKQMGYIGAGGELAGEIATFGGIGTGAIGVGQSAGLQKAFEPVKTDEGLKERGIEGTKSAIKGYVFGKAVETAIKGYGAVKGAFKTAKASKYWDDMGETVVKLKKKASNVYKTMSELNAGINEQASSKISNSLDDVFVKSGKLNKRLHGDTMSVWSDFKKVLKTGKIGIDDLDQHRQLLNQVVMKNTNIAGNVNPDGRKAIILIKKLDDVVDNLLPKDLANQGKNAIDLLKVARSDWKTYKKYQKIVNLVEKSGGDPNRIKALFKRFVIKKKNLMGFTDLEKKALMRVAQNTSGEKILKSLGKFGIDLGTSLTPGNTFMPAASMFASSLSGSPQKGVGIVISGTLARQAQKSLAKGKVVDALSIIEKGGFEDIAKVVRMAPTKIAQKQLLAKILSYTISGEKINKKEEE